MKKSLIIIVFVFLLSSCRSTYFYSTLSSPDEPVEKVDNGDFLFETDSLWIAYCFKGEGAPMQITVFNKSDQPLYIDWSKSALIIDNTAITYGGEKLEINGEWDAALLENASAEGSFDGTVSLPKDVSFIPPQSMISEIPVNLNPSFDHIDKKKYKDIQFVDKKGFAQSAKRLDFEQNDTPLAFKSYLTLYYDPSQLMAYEQDFYLSSLIRTSSISPGNMPDNLTDRGDLFTVVKPANNSAFYTTLGIVGITGLVVVGVVYGKPVPVDYEYGY